MPVRSFHPLRRASCAVLVLLAVLVVGGCQTQEATTEADVTVGGTFSQRPQVSFDEPLTVPETTTEEVIHGDGTVLADGAAVMLAYLAIDAMTGEVIDDSFNNEAEAVLLTPDTAGPLYVELVGRPEGTRLLRLEVGTTTKPHPLVLVYDILHTRAWGEEIPPVEGVPTVTRDDTGAPTVTLPGTEPPADLVIVPLIRGTGPQVRPGQSVTVRYTSVSWSTGEVLDTIWGEGMAPTTIPFTGLIQGWQDGLVDETVGSEVMLVVPPDQAFGTDTLVYVIDVLAVTSPAEPDGGAG